MTTATKTLKSHVSMLEWQYRTLIAELSHVTLHSSDESCPCNQVDLNPPEYCLGKHLLTVSSLASETSLMDPPHGELLDTLSSEALEYHNKAKVIYCKGGTWPDLATWSREWRKKLEPLYYSCGTGKKAKLHDVAELETKKKVPFSESRLCYGVEQAYKKLKGIDKSLGMSKSAVAKIQKDLTTPGNICAGQAEMMSPTEPATCDTVSSKYRYLTLFFQSMGDDYVFSTEAAVIPRKIDQALAQLEQGVQAIQDSENFRAYLKTVAKFHHYSLGNIILISIQKSNATMVAGFNKWKELSRNVKPGEHGIMILAPCFPPKPKAEKPKEESEENGIESDKPEVPLLPIFFKVVYVFDLSQTEGEPIASVEVPVLVGEDTISLYRKLESLATKRNIKIDRKEQEAGGAMGYWSKSISTIWVKPGVSTNQSTKTLIHELAHAICDNEGCGGPGVNAETIAESVAYCVGQHFGFDTGVRSFPYVATWGEDIKVLKRNLDKIRLISQKMIDSLDVIATLEAPKVQKDPFGSRCRDPKTGYWIESKDCGFSPEGAKTEAISGNGKDRYMFEHVITDVDKLIVSNNPFTYEVNPLYPKELQPRLRDRKASRIQVEKIAAGLIPDALITDFHSLDRGSPIIGPDMVVEAGNGRVMALQLAVKSFPLSYKAYTDRLKERITDFGIGIKDMEKIEHPVLVRLRLTDVDRVAFSKSTNTSAVMVPSSIEVAKIDAEDITLEMIKNLTVLENESIEDALKSSRNQAFAMRFMKNLPENEQANVVDAKGILNRDGVQRMVMAIFVSAFPGETGLALASKAFETIDQDVKNTVNALARALGPLAEAEALIRQGQRDATLSVANDIAQAITIYSKIRQLPELTVDKYFSQSQMFGKELSPFQEKVLLTIDKYRRSPNRLGAIFSGYARSVVAQPPPQQTSMMAMAPVSKEQLWDNAERRTAEELETERKTKEDRIKRQLTEATAMVSEMQPKPTIESGYPTETFTFTGEYTEVVPGAGSRMATRNKKVTGYAPVYVNKAGQRISDMSQATKEKPATGQAMMFSPPIPKLIEVHPNVIIKHYAETKAMIPDSIRTTKPTSAILLILGCPKKSDWSVKSSTCKPNPVVIATHVPNTAKYRNDLEKLLKDYPKLKDKVKHYTTEGKEAQVEETRIFNGKPYRLFDWVADDKEAKDEISELEKEGYLVEKTPADEGYQIWVNDSQAQVEDNVEKGFAVCETSKGKLVPGPQAVGDKSSVSVTMHCPAGTKTKAIYHVHPSGNLEPSEKDLEASKKFKVPVCAGTIDGKKVECHAA